MSEQLQQPGTTQKLLAEALGTFVLVLVGCGSVVLSRAADLGNGAPLRDLVGVADTVSVGLAFGVAVLVMAYAVGRISGGHFNPAVTLGAAVGGRLPWRSVPGYALAQLGGATLAARLLFGIGSGFDGWEADPATMGANGFTFAWWSAFLLEMVLTAVFLYVILGVTDFRNEHPALAPLAIGLALAAIHFVAIPATGTSVNPARSFVRPCSPAPTPSPSRGCSSPPRCWGRRSRARRTGCCSGARLRCRAPASPDGRRPCRVRRAGRAPGAVEPGPGEPGPGEPGPGPRPGKPEWAGRTRRSVGRGAAGPWSAPAPPAVGRTPGPVPTATPAPGRGAGQAGR